ncbi:MAG: carbamoyl phosphate synthase small subunit [Bacteroidetes bacterium RBG_13_46_8]|nr:MAG: carbamoyl phosphate synthase small subunit [Bacteroidetes bacterium RBG_13_46_8]
MAKSNGIKLILEDGTTWYGYTFGFARSVSGEVVFNTAMTGYPESLTDPSYKGQILVLTYPIIGNYGVPDYVQEDGMLKYFESYALHITGLVISDYTEDYSHWNSKKSLGDWLKEYKIPGIYGIDTRALTKILREKGTMLGKIICGDEKVDFYDPNKDNLVMKVSTGEKKVYGSGKHRILLVDCGVKYNIIRNLLKRDTTVTVVPWDYDFTEDKYDGLFISNGPGDPKECTDTIRHLRKAITGDIPIYGICLGNQLLALAAGADTYKLKYGHRSHNQPVLLNNTQKAYITSQNHGFAIDNATLPRDWEPLFTNLNDNTNEGMRHVSKPFFSTQFHPEASGGPTDTEFLFDRFIEMIENHKKS